MRFHSRVEAEQKGLDRAKFEFLYGMQVKLRPSEYATSLLLSADLLPEEEKIARVFYADLMRELFNAVGFAHNEVVLACGEVDI